jgi:geranylgeranyl pyrophosphate synthase
VDGCVGRGGRQPAATGHLKRVPETRDLRERLKAECEQVAGKLEKSVSLTRKQMETAARRLLASLQLPEGYVGWTMVMLSSAFFREAVAATPPTRRLLLLPRCIRHEPGGAYEGPFGLDCRSDDACCMADFRHQAQARGYQVMAVEVSPRVLEVIVGGTVDAIVGVASLDVLEKAIDKLLLAGIPCMAVPWLGGEGRQAVVDKPWVEAMIATPAVEPSPEKARSYVPLMRGAAQLFQQPKLDHLLMRSRSETATAAVGLDPLVATEAIAIDFLSKGGKYSRPFMTLAAYDAMTGGLATLANGAERVAAYPEAVLRGALCIELFHKASLIHDDIEDDDGFRYGLTTLHREYGVPIAINVGDYLIGLGYRMITREAEGLGQARMIQILDGLAHAHTRLAEGQGAELLWRDRSDKRLTPVDALKIYALKTAPAFEAALLTGIRLAGEPGELVESVRLFSRNIGIAFQILNDLQDWSEDHRNKGTAGGDILGGRPTLLLALALDVLDRLDQECLLAMLAKECADGIEERLATVRRLFEKADVFQVAQGWVAQHQRQAVEIAQRTQPEAMRRFLVYLVETVLQPRGPFPPTVVPLPPAVTLPVAIR